MDQGRDRSVAVVDLLHQPRRLIGANGLGPRGDPHRPVFEGTQTFRQSLAHPGPIVEDEDDAGP